MSRGQISRYYYEWWEPAFALYICLSSNAALQDILDGQVPVINMEEDLERSVYDNVLDAVGVPMDSTNRWFLKKFIDIMDAPSRESGLLRYNSVALSLVGTVYEAREEMRNMREEFGMYFTTSQILTELIRKHVTDVGEMMQEHFGGECNQIARCLFEVTTGDSKCPTCEVEQIIHSGSKFHYHGKEIKMLPIIRMVQSRVVED